MTARAPKTEEYRSTQEQYCASQGDEITTVPCHDDLTASGLVGRYYNNRRRNCVGGRANGARVLPMEKTGELLEAPVEFCLAIFYNPGYQVLTYTR